MAYDSLIMIQLPRIIIFVWVGLTVLLIVTLGISLSVSQFQFRNQFNITADSRTQSQSQLQFPNRESILHHKDSSTQKISSIQNMIALLNYERAKSNLPPLLESPKLNATALEKACDMLERDYFDHVDPDGREAWHLYTAKGYQYLFAGENLIEGYETDQQALQALLESERHRANILSTQFEDIGIGRCGDFVVQHFGVVGYGL